MNKLKSVIGFTFANKVKNRAFLVTTIIFIVIISILVNLPYLIQLFSGDDKKAESTHIGLIVGNQTEIATQLEKYAAQPEAGFTIKKYANSASPDVKKDIEDKKISGYVEFKDTTVGDFPVVTFVKKGDGQDTALLAKLQSALQIVKTQIITKGSLNDTQIAALNQPVDLDAERYTGSANSPGSDEGKGKQNFANYLFVSLLILIFWMTILTTGNMISSEVTSEKSSRIMEILITSVSPLTQMFGKIIGMFLIGLLQISIFIAVGILNALLPYNRTALADYDINLSQLDLSVLFYGLLFYVMGYLLYATLYAAVGSMVSRTEDLGQAVMPLTMINMASFYIGSFSASNPNTMLVKIASYVPFTSPVSMLLRIGLGEVSALEIAMSLLILAVSIFFFGWLSAKIYRTGVLLYGKRPSWKEIRKAMQAYKI
ncbi:ABC-2 type transport system permease protein [Paenibacillus shirakamiensis]|uniref:ABC-2 type transport system permease protein n=1 Tax=Paenibacillus shirakamiensis TaxID=1265935 RepID=A0ABS4JIY1_9BACL|nr:ABC transporter permease [Paenibacillus shirakamiensis]MBP2001658.1 ABC-2 type transport system permease protein [Paenibacillus shirakamiensis]